MGRLRRRDLTVEAVTSDVALGVRSHQYLATHSNPWIRARWARRPDTPTELVRAGWGSDNHAWVRNSLVGNCAVPFDEAAPEAEALGRWALSRLGLRRDCPDDQAAALVRRLGTTRRGQVACMAVLGDAAWRGRSTIRGKELTEIAAVELYALTSEICPLNLASEIRTSGGQRRLVDIVVGNRSNEVAVRMLARVTPTPETSATLLDLAATLETPVRMRLEFLAEPTAERLAALRQEAVGSGISSNLTVFLAAVAANSAAEATVRLFVDTVATWRQPAFIRALLGREDLDDASVRTVAGLAPTYLLEEISAWDTSSALVADELAQRTDGDGTARRPQRDTPNDLLERLLHSHAPSQVDVLVELATSSSLSWDALSVVVRALDL